MVSHLFYYQLALLALVWLFVMLHVTESRRGTPIPPTATPITPKRTRSHEPQPFAGLTHKPVESKYSHALSHGRLRPYHSHLFDWCSSSPSPHTQSLSEKVTPWMAGE